MLCIMISFWKNKKLISALLDKELATASLSSTSFIIEINVEILRPLNALRLQKLCIFNCRAS